MPRLLAIAVLASVALALSWGPGSDPGAPASATAGAAPALAAVRGQSAKSRRPALKLMWGPNNLPNGSSAFPTYRRLGVDVLQTQLVWSRIARREPATATDPTDPAYEWPAAIDETVARSAASGIDVAFLVRATPAWAGGGPTGSRAPTQDRQYAEFLTAAAKRYPKVRFWMIWGEPTRLGNFEPMPANSPVGPRRYATLLDAAYSSLKRANRNNKVIGGMTWTVGLVRPPTFIRYLRLPNGKPPRMDYFGHNPYATRFPRLSRSTYAPGVRDISDIDTLHGELARRYAKRSTPRLWLSEFSIASDRPNRGFNFSVSRRSQAEWLTAAFKVANAAPYVVGLGWYDLYDEPRSVKNGLTNGLLTASGAPKPAFAAYRRAR